VTAGTFLNGLIHIGMESFPAGRLGEPPSKGLSESLASHGLATGRLKTGTSPRVSISSLDFTRMQAQPGDDEPAHFSHRTRDFNPQQMCCHLTRTSELTHRIIRKNLDRSPLFQGIIKGIGPRYCPSIEDKVFRFADRSSHQVFAEPDGRNTQVCYLNGVSTSLPPDVQADLLRTIPGLEQVEIIKPGYAVEYDFVNPVMLHSALEAKTVRGLFLAGQVNGTSGYEEAAAQGLIAGINAARLIKRQPFFIPKRSESYIGVMLDDLVTKGVDEPYRMFTSRAEFRLLLRQDNAMERLSGYGVQCGLVSKSVREGVREKTRAVASAAERLKSSYLRPDAVNQFLLSAGSSPVREPVSAYQLLKRPEVSSKDLSQFVEDTNPDIIGVVEIEAKYGGYIDRQLSQVARSEELEARLIPEDMDYSKAFGLSYEARQKLSKVSPRTVGQASRVPGITPADVTALLVEIKKQTT
jgi:tRNA uridine 5-carboxymethylaminomethyl modification enzyme